MTAWWLGGATLLAALAVACRAEGLARAERWATRAAVIYAALALLTWAR